MTVFSLQGMPAGKEKTMFQNDDVRIIEGANLLSGERQRGKSVLTQWRIAGFMLGMLLAFQAEAAATYSITDLGANSTATGINASGQVVGYSDIGFLRQHAFIYSGVAMTDIGTLGGNNSYGLGINASGQVTGWSFTAGGAQRAFLYSGGTMTDLGTLPGGDLSAGTAINASGQVAGYSDIGGGAGHAFLYSGGTMTDLGTLGGAYSEGDGINASGQVTGRSLTAGGVLHAFLYSSGFMSDLGTLGGAFSEGIGINGLGQVTGESWTAGGMNHAFLYSHGTMTDLNSLIDPGLGWNLHDADGINDAGQIVGTGIIGGEGHAFLLTPIQTMSSGVPELSTWAMMLLGFAGLGIAGYRRTARRPQPCLSA
jgi:probable HAF family extracellular repeat protein